MKRLIFAAVFSTIAVAAAIASSGSFSAFSPSLTDLSASGPRYTTDDEQIVSEIAGSILNIAAFADHFEPGEPFHVRNVGAHTPGTHRFSLARRAEVFTVELSSHAWRPASYERLARSFMADGADMVLGTDGYRDRADASVWIEAGEDVLRAQNVRLSRLLAEHPRSAALHERAGVLLAVSAARRAASGEDIRPLLCRMTAHLAVARALHDGVLGSDGELAERMLAGLAGRDRADARTGGAWIEGPVTFGEHPRVEIVPDSTSQR
jgi:hypothetical protein